MGAKHDQGPQQRRFGRSERPRLVAEVLQGKDAA